MSDGVVTAGFRTVSRGAWGLGLLAVLAAGCTASSSTPEPTTEAAPPPAPPAACLLDTAGLSTATGLSWTPDQSTASDTRCLYDPGAPTAPPTPATAATGSGSSTPDDQPSTVEPVANDFLTVEIAPLTATDAETELDGIAPVCLDGSRTPIADGGAGFVCRFRGGSVFAAIVRAGQVVTVSASAVPEGTTAARLVVALQQQLDTLGR